MRRVLLVLEDYNESLFAATILKKVGFDVQTIPSEMSLPDQLMVFLPDIVIATGDGQRVNGHSVSKKVKKKGLQTKLVLVFGRQKLTQKDFLSGYFADGAIETPINPRGLIRSVCDFTGVPSDPVLAKFDKLPLTQTEAQSEIQIISGGKATPPTAVIKGEKTVTPTAQINSAAEVSPKPKTIIINQSKGGKYAKFLVDSPQSPFEVFDQRAVDKERRRQRDIPDSPQELEIDEKKKNFVEKLFKTWKRS